MRQEGGKPPTGYILKARNSCVFRGYGLHGNLDGQYVANMASYVICSEFDFGDS
jgi:hypothetical protein